jgi:VanZ like protein
MSNRSFWKWIPASLMMGVIFWFSAHASADLPNFGWADVIVKKSGHVIGYALLTFSYWYALGIDKNKCWLAWLLAILYALTDEYHQTFVQGRHPSIWDVLIFDNLGALASLWLTDKFIKQNDPTKTPDRPKS